MIRYIIIGSIFYVGFLFATFPANMVYSYWKEYLGGNNPLTLSGVEGSIWSGHASQVIFKGQKMQPLDWSFRPLQLLLGKAELNWEFSVPDGYGKGQSGYSLLNGYYLENVEAWLPVRLLAPYSNLSALSPAGMISINMERLQSDGKTITAATGQLAWQEAEITLFKPVTLGNYEVDLIQEGDIISGTLKDKGGPIEADGKFTLTKEGDYNVDGHLAVRDSTRKDLKQALQSFGRADRQGKVKLTRKGNLSQLGLF